MSLKLCAVFDQSHRCAENRNTQENARKMGLITIDFRYSNHSFTISFHIKWFYMYGLNGTSLPLICIATVHTPCGSVFRNSVEQCKFVEITVFVCVVALCVKCQGTESSFTSQAMLRNVPQQNTSLRQMHKLIECGLIVAREAPSITSRIYPSSFWASICAHIAQTIITSPNQTKC